MVMLRLASSKVVSNAVRAISSPKILPGSIVTVPRESYASQQFSTAAGEHKRVDKELAKVLKSKSKSGKRLVWQTKMPEAPAGSFYQIRDIPGESTIKLTGESGAEKIVIEVNEAWNPEDKNVVSDSSDEDYSDDDISSDENEPFCLFTVTVTPKKGTMSKEFSCRATEYSIAIKSIEFKGSPSYILGPSTLRFSGDEDDKDLEEYWRKTVLGGRGIDVSLGRFMLNYMIKRYRRDHLLFLNKFRKFVKGSN